MLPRPRTIFLLFGMLIVVLGLYGLFNTTLLKLNAESSYASGGLGTIHNIKDPKLNDSFGIISWITAWLSMLPPGLVRSVIRNAHAALSNPLAIGIAGCIVVMGIRRKCRPEDLPIWIRGICTAANIFLALAVLLFSMECFIFLARLSINHWWLFLVSGGAFSLLVILFNSEELTEKWMTVVSKSSVFVGLAVMFLLAFYCYAVNQYSTRTAGLIREQKSQDRAEYRDLVASHTDKSDFKVLLSQSEDLINSDREISLSMARYIFKVAAELPSPGLDDSASPNWKEKSFATIFPQPRILSNQDRWRDVREQFVNGETAYQSFDSYIQKCMFGNEDLRRSVPYRTYLENLREERYPRKTDLALRDLDPSFDGDLDEMKQQLRLRNLKELDDLPPHCEILFTSSDEKMKAKAEEVARQLRATRRFIVPTPKFISLNSVDKRPGMSLSIFARGETEYRSNILRILETTGIYIPKTGESRTAIDADIKQFCNMNVTTFDLYSDGVVNQPERQETLKRLRSKTLNLTNTPGEKNAMLLKVIADLNADIYKLVQQEKREKEQAPILDTISKKMRLSRELTTLSVILEYGKPENHFEIWLIPE